MAPRILLHLGPGGAGRSAVAAATARRVAASGARTLLLASDPARGLEGVLGTPLPAVAAPVGDGVHAEHVDADTALERACAALGDVGAATAARLVAPPGADAAWGLLRLEEHATSGAWDVVVVDGPPAGEALRLLALPELARGWLDRLDGEPAHALRPFARVALDVALPGGDALEALAALGRRLAGLHDLLCDEEHAAVRLVCGPGAGPREVALRLARAVRLHGVAVGAVVLNRVEDAGAETAFAPLPVLRVPELPGEARGPAALDALGAALAAAHDPAVLGPLAPSSVGEPSLGDAHPTLDGAGAWAARGAERLEVDGAGARLRLPVPFARRDEVAVQRVGDDLVVRVDGLKRALALPPALHGHRARGARVADGELVVRFEAP